jgi:membrane-bound lytic murein transglycosylase D
VKRSLRSAVVWCTTATLAAQSAPPPAPVDADQLYQLGKQVFEGYAPPEVKAQFEFPTKEQWDNFGARLQRALEGESLEDLADLLPEARAAAQALKTIPGYEDYGDWLEQRVDELEGAQQVVGPRPPAPKIPRPPTRPGTPLAPGEPVPNYQLWLARVRGRPLPARAAELMPRLRAAFVAEGVPPELAWLAEAESSLNPAARSPVGAKGLFQFMPATAKAMGLSTLLPDERANPEKAARAAARYLRQLHGKFNNWALAIAAYNAGEGRVGRTLAARKASTFTAIADGLPAETRMYVPKVCALIATRAGVSPDKIGSAGGTSVGAKPETPAGQSAKPAR